MSLETYICMACETRMVKDSKPKRCIKPSCQKGGGYIRLFTEESYKLAGGGAAKPLEAMAQGEELAAIMRTPRGDVSAKAGEMERNAPLFFGTGENPSLF